MTNNLSHQLFNQYSHALFISSVTTNTISLVVNMLIMAVYLNYAILKTSTNIYIAFGTASALLLTILDFTFYSAQAYTRKCVISEVLTCIVEAFIQPALGYFIILNITFVAVQRILAITRGSRFSRAINRRKACVMFSLSVVYIGLVCLGPLYGWYSMRAQGMNRVHCYVEFYTEAYLAVVFVLARTVLLFVVPFLLMAMCYYIVYSTVKTTAVQRTLKRSQRYNACSPDLSASARCKRRSMRTRLEARTVRTVIAVLTVFFGVLSTYEVFTVYLSLTEVTLSKLIAYHVLWLTWKFFTQIFAMSQVLLNTHFRQHFLFSVCRRYRQSGDVSSTFHNAKTTSNGGTRWSGRQNRLGPPSASYAFPSASSETNYRCEISTIIAEDARPSSELHQIVNRSCSILNKTGKTDCADGCSSDVTKKTVTSTKSTGRGLRENGTFLQVPNMSRNVSSNCNRSLRTSEYHQKSLLFTNPSEIRHSTSAPCLRQALLKSITFDSGNRHNMSRSQVLLTQRANVAESAMKEVNKIQLPTYSASEMSSRTTKDVNGVISIGREEIEM